MKSIYQNLGGVIEMPEFKQRNVYMHKTSMDNLKLPAEFQDFGEAVERCLSKLSDRSSVCYITIDEKEICGDSHRRGGIHVDYNWYEAAGWENTNIWGNKMTAGQHQAPGQHVGGVDKEQGGMLLVSNYEGCRVYKGDFTGVIDEGGDCSCIDVSDLGSEIMKPGEVYYLNALGIHESLKIKNKVKRSLIRINFHPDYIYKVA
jgi:hypothetical protein